MSKICGYSCKNNKSGACQTLVCDKQLIMSDKTEVQTYTRYIDTTTTELQQESKQLQERIEYLERSNNRREDTILEQRQKISDLEDNWDKLKVYIKTEIPEDVFIDTEWFVSILDKMQELEKSDSNE